MFSVTEIERLISVVCRAIERLALVGCGPLCIVFGYKLYMAGAKGELKSLSTEGHGWKVKLEKVSAGAFVFLVGLSIIYLGFFKGSGIETTSIDGSGGSSVIYKFYKNPERMDFGGQGPINK